jgi:acetylornithine deacetylase/succinyl-diaminopimelate desuccinylase-like protein
VRALNRVIDWQTPIRLLPQVEEFFHGIAETQSESRRPQFRHIRESLDDPEFVRWISSQEQFNYMLRDTISLTGLEGSQQTNIIPSQASARLDIRLLPGTDRNEFRKALEQKINDAHIDITELTHYRTPNSSPTDTELYRSIAAAARAAYPQAVVVPTMSGGYNESQMYRQLGIDCYGFTPYAVSEAESASEHSDNERIGEAELKSGQPVFFEAVRPVVEAGNKHAGD